MPAAHTDVTVIVRECGERTAEASVVLLRRLFPGREIHRVKGRPFAATLKRSLQMGLSEGRPWTLCIDADVLVLPELVELLLQAKNSPEGVFEIQGLVFDKLMTAPRAAGNHLYRTGLIDRALPLIPAGPSLRPETEMIEAMGKKGFPSRQLTQVVGLHDFEQWYGDLYAKAYLHGHKHQFLMPLYRPLWQMLAREDDDYRVALIALDSAQQQTATPSVSRDERALEAHQAIATIALTEKPPLEQIPDDPTLRAWTTTVTAQGEAKTVSRQIASAVMHGTFPDDGTRPKTPTVFADKHPSVALLCANAYPLFDFCISAVTGGMEARAALFGRGLAATGRWHLSFIVSDFGQPFVTRHEGIDFRIYQPTYRRAGRNVFPRLRRRRWFPILNLDGRDLDLLWQIPLIAAWLALPAFFFPRFWRSLKPDVVCCFGNNTRSAEVIADCRRQGIRTILFVASDKDISPDYCPGNRALNHYGMPKWKGHYALAAADQIIVQTEAQRTALLRNFGRDATLIRNPVHVSPDDPQHWLPRDRREFVIWIGRADDFNKRPMLFVELARACPGLTFLMIVARTNEASFVALSQARPNNMRLVEHVRQHEIWEYLRRARVLVNTSRFEGFPNTFLQSAVMGVPIVSLEVDPDSMLARHGCGICAGGDTHMMREAVTRFCADGVLADAHADACHRYALERHAAEARIVEIETSIRELIGQGNASVRRPRMSLWRRFV